MEPEGIISITLEEETEESVYTSVEIDEVIGSEISQVHAPYTLDNARPPTDGEWRIFYGNQRLQTLQPLTRPYEFVPRDLVDRESLNTMRPLFVDRASLDIDTLRSLELQEDVENPSGLPPNISREEEIENRLVMGVDLSGTHSSSNTEWFEFNGNGTAYGVAVEPDVQPVTQPQASVTRDFVDRESLDFSESLVTESIGIPLAYRLGIDSKKTTKPVVTPTDNPNIFNVDWVLNKPPFTEFNNQKKFLFDSDDIYTIEKHAIISISNKETVNLLKSTDNSLMLLREYIPQNIKRDIDNNINVPSLLFGTHPKYISQFTLEYISDMDLKPHDWEYVKKNVYKRNYGTGDTGHHALSYFKTVTSDINESKSERVLKNLIGILGFVKFSGYLSSVRDPEEFAEAAAQMGMNEDDIFKKTRGFKELFILKLTDFDFRKLWRMRYFSKRPDGVIELNTKDIWGNNRHPHKIETVYL